MKSSTIYGVPVIMLILIVFLQATACAAQTEPPLTWAEIAAELSELKDLFELMPLEIHTPAQLKQRLLALGFKVAVEKRSLFDYERWELEKSGKNKSISFEVCFYKNDLAGYWLDLFSVTDKALAQKIRDFWLAHGGTVDLNPRFKAKVSKLRKPVFDDYYQRVASGLGDLRPVTVPDDLQRAYSYLVSDIYSTTVGSFCGFGGSAPIGKIYTDLLVAAHRIDLLENILYGFNPGGRIYAALALFNLGMSDKPAIQQAIASIVNKNIAIGVCGGCEFGSVKTPEEVQTLIQRGG